MKNDAMDFIALARKRQSVRSYNLKPVETEKINKCLEAARLAPSACNSQPWKFIIVTEPGLRHKVADATSNRILPLNHLPRKLRCLLLWFVKSQILHPGWVRSSKTKHLH